MIFLRDWFSLGRLGLVITCAVLVLCAPIVVKAKVLRMGWPATPVTAAYPFARDDGAGLRNAFYDSLTWFDAKGVLHPRLAVSWKNESPKVWVFQLREGVLFSNGVPFNAETVVAALDIFYDPETLHPRTADIGRFESYRARGPFELEITTAQPDPIFPRRIAQLPVIEPSAWKEMGQEVYSKEPVATGPYRAVSWGGNNTRPILEYIPTSWRGIGNVDRVEITITSDPGSRVSGLLSGQLDLIGSLASDDIPTVEAAGFKVHRTESPNILSIAFRTIGNEGSPLTDVRVRRALNHAVDKRGIVDFILGELNRVVHQPAAPGVVGYNPDIPQFDYNPDKARVLLAEAGYADGFPLKFAVYGGLLPNDTLIFQKVGQDLGAIGVQTELRQISFPDYVRRLFNADWDDIDGFSIGWLHVSTWDPQRSIDQFSCAYSAPFYCDQELMPLIDQARVEMDPVRREELLTEIIYTLSQSGAALWLVDFSGSVAYDANIEVGPFRLDGTMFEQMTFH